MIRLAVIGCTGAAERYIHVVPRVAAKFVAAVDPDLTLASCTAAALGASISATSLDELIQQHAQAFDAVVVLSANGLHRQQAQLAMRSGKHALVESPLALDHLADLAVTHRLDDFEHLLRGNTETRDRVAIDRDL